MKDNRGHTGVAMAVSNELTEHKTRRLDEENKVSRELKNLKKERISQRLPCDTYVDRRDLDSHQPEVPLQED